MMEPCGPYIKYLFGPTLFIYDMAMSITLRHIEVFRAIMTSGSVTAAAAMLHTSQPTVSRELARLEYLTGLALFERERGRLRPTAHALQLFEEVQRAYFGLERIVSTATALRQFDQGQLSIACLPVFSQSLLPQACRRFVLDYPNVSISITPQESPLLEEWLSAQRHDIGITEVGNAPPGTALHSLMSVDEVCVLPDGHPLAAQAVLTPQDFAGLPFISLAQVDPYRQQIDDIFREAGVERRLALDTHSAASVCAMVREGMGVAIVNPLTALDFAGQGLQIRRFAVALPFTVNLVKPLHRPLSQLVAPFEQALKAQADIVRQRLQRL